VPAIPLSNSVRRVSHALRDAEHAPDAWSGGLKLLTGTLSVAGAACIIFNKKTGRADWACFSGLSSELESRYIDRFAALDPFSPLLNATPGWTRLLTCLPAPVLAKSEWYNEFVLRCGVRDIIGAKLAETPSHFGIVGLHQQIGRHYADVDPILLHSLTEPLISATRSRVNAFSFADKEEPEAHCPPVGSRYFFHICNGQTYVDTAGHLLPSSDAAVAHAVLLAAELSQDEGLRGFAVCVTDETGRLVSRRPIHPREGNL
jgi:hypothetical protein